MADILIVDDASCIRRLISIILIKGGHIVVGRAENAKEGLELYKILKPDIVTLDILMPIYDGIDSIRALREMKRIDKEAKVIIVSSVDQEKIMAEFMQVGAKDYIVKPFKDSDLLGAISRVLDSQAEHESGGLSKTMICYSIG